MPEKPTLHLLHGSKVTDPDATLKFFEAMVGRPATEEEKATNIRRCIELAKEIERRRKK